MKRWGGRRPVPALGNERAPGVEATAASRGGQATHTLAARAGKGSEPLAQSQSRARVRAPALAPQPGTTVMEALPPPRSCNAAATRDTCTGEPNCSVATASSGHSLAPGVSGSAPEDHSPPVRLDARSEVTPANETGGAGSTMGRRAGR
jgi:hypothetical protein